MLNPGNYDGNYTADAGALCLDFANTLSWRMSDHPHEWLTRYSDLIAWGEIAGALTSEEARAMLENGAITPEIGTNTLERAIRLREAIYQIFVTTANLAPPPQEAIDTLNAEVALAHSKRSLQWNGTQFEWRTDLQADDPERVLWPVALSAAEMLGSPEVARVGECQGKGCGWLFLDTSKNHSRRWCSMNDCGNREKARKHYRRKQGLPEGE